MSAVTKAIGLAKKLKHRYQDEIREALAKGMVTEQDIEVAIRGNVRVMLRLGLLDGKNSPNPYATMGTDTTATPPFMTEEARNAVREVTNKSVVGRSLH